jgi:hypothetical protein
MNQNTQAKTTPFLFILIFAAILVAVGVASRIVLADSPNFKPVCALALFAGFYFNRFWLAGIVVALILVVSDLVLGGYEWQLMAAVYGSTLIAALLGLAIKNRQSGSAGFQLFGQFATASLAMSFAFFVLTNFAVWAFGGWYPSTLAGLADCYYAAIPFFRWTLVSDFVFSQALIAAYIVALGWVVKPNPVTSC